ncbi:MAG: arylsulfatase [Cyclobacteriaceae bacterium]
MSSALLCAALCLLFSCSQQSSEPQQPNIIFILADDLGYGDLSFLGQKKFTTPNIDKLASEGMVLTQHYAGSTVCAPSRSALLTGYHTGHTAIRGNISVQPEGQWPLPEESYTMAEMLKSVGYSTAAFGKWGLGFINSPGDPNKQGFDYFYGYNSQTLAHNYYPDHLWDNDRKVILHENNEGMKGQYAPDIIHQRALDYIKYQHNNPFFLYYATPIPHAELITTDLNMKDYEGSYDPEQPYMGVDYGEEGFRQGPYGSQPMPKAAFAAMIALLDRQVGELVDALKEEGLDDNTLIVFTSDNGPHQEGGADPDFFDSNGRYKGYKRDLFEGGIRVPTIIKWPGHIEAKSNSEHISAFWDWLPTFAEMTGAELPSIIDGISFLPTLLGQPDQQINHDYLYWEFHELGGRQAVRKEDYKLIKYHVLDTSQTRTMLFDIKNDPSETNDLSQSKPEIVQELSEIMSSARVPSDVFTFQAETIIK